MSADESLTGVAAVRAGHSGRTVTSHVTIIGIDNTGSSTTLETFTVCTVGASEWGFTVAG